MKAITLWILTAVQSCHISLGQDSEELPESRGSSCICVPVYRCYLKVPVDGAGILDPRTGAGEGCPDLEVCCPPESLHQEVPRPAQCGMQYHSGTVDLHIAGGSDAQFGEFPWMVAVLAPERRFVSGGSLIHPRIVLTAAHSLLNFNHHELSIRVGEWSSQTNQEPLPVQNHAVRKVVVHESFNPETLFNDIALLFLESPVKLGGNVGTICLPPPNQSMDGRNCLASGWGKNSLGPEGEHPDILKKVELAIVPQEKCQNILRSTKLGPYFRLHISFLCAGGKQGHDTCKGDGGGPLVCPSQGNPAIYVQAGIVSWGIDCGRDTPAAYTNVALFSSWIELKALQQGIAI